MGTQQAEQADTTKGRPGVRWDCIPAVTVLLAVATFWIGGSFEWFELLRVPGNAVGNVVWLYFMLAAVAGSVVLGGGALVDLARRLGRRPGRDQ